ncbi:hypothetical protein QFC21_004548 [Naganishia friedmannii]|uniref:Uncharacterized protein n=1 Tax=Naganishia friedmannii TaxID=89922 RepID=A0ACC2VGV2_9TREE|nr:hypothetical protein QFC21_004548 [Naganishia friedmannii]
MPFWPLLLLFTHYLITPVFASLYGYTNTTIVNYDYDPTTKVTTATSSSVFLSSVIETPARATVSPIATSFSGDMATSTVTVTVTSTLTSTEAPKPSSTSSSAAPNVIRQESGPLHSAGSPPRTYDDILQGLHLLPDAETYLDAEGSKVTSFSMADIMQDLYPFGTFNQFAREMQSRTASDTQQVCASSDDEPSDSGQEGNATIRMDSREKRRRFVLSSQAEEITSFAYGPVWGYTVDFGVNRMPNNWAPETDPPRINDLVERFEEAIARNEGEAKAYNVERQLSEKTRLRQETVIKEWESENLDLRRAYYYLTDRATEFAELINLNAHVSDSLWIKDEVQHRKAKATSRMYVQAQMTIFRYKFNYDTTNIASSELGRCKIRSTGKDEVIHIVYAALNNLDNLSRFAAAHCSDASTSEIELQVPDVNQVAADSAPELTNENETETVHEDERLPPQSFSNGSQPIAEPEPVENNVQAPQVENDAQVPDVGPVSASSDNTNDNEPIANTNENETLADTDETEIVHQAEAPRPRSPSHASQWQRQDNRYVAAYRRRHPTDRRLQSRSPSPAREERVRDEVVPVQPSARRSTPVSNSAVDTELDGGSVTPVTEIERLVEYDVNVPSSDTMPALEESVNNVQGPSTETRLDDSPTGHSSTTTEESQSSDSEATAQVQEVALVTVLADSDSSRFTSTEEELVPVTHVQTSVEQVEGATNLNQVPTNRDETDAQATLEEQASASVSDPVATMDIVDSQQVVHSQSTMNIEVVMEDVEAAINTHGAQPIQASMVVEETEVPMQAAQPPRTQDVIMEDAEVSIDARNEPVMHAPMVVEEADVAVHVAEPPPAQDVVMEDLEVPIEAHGDWPMQAPMAVAEVEVRTQVAQPPRAFPPAMLPTPTAFDFGLPQAAPALPIMAVELASVQLPSSFAFGWPQAAQQTVSHAPFMYVEPAPNGNVQPASAELPNSFNFGLPYAAPQEPAPPALNMEVDPASVQVLLDRFEANYQMSGLTPVQQGAEEVRSPEVLNWSTVTPEMRRVRGLPKTIRAQPAPPTMRHEEPASSMNVNPAMIDPVVRDPAVSQSGPASTRVTIPGGPPAVTPTGQTSNGFKVPRLPEKLWNLSRPKTVQPVPPQALDPTRPAAAPWSKKAYISNAAPVRTSVFASAPAAPQRPVARAPPRPASDNMWIPKRRTIKPFPPRTVVNPPVQAHPPVAKATERVVESEGVVDMTYEQAAALEDISPTPNVVRRKRFTSASLATENANRAATATHVASLQSQPVVAVTQASSGKGGALGTGHSNSLATQAVGTASLAVAPSATTLADRPPLVLLSTNPVQRQLAPKGQHVGNLVDQPRPLEFIPEVIHEEVDDGGSIKQGNATWGTAGEQGAMEESTEPERSFSGSTIDEGMLNGDRAALPEGAGAHAMKGVGVCDAGFDDSDEDADGESDPEYNAMVEW